MVSEFSDLNGGGGKSMKGKMIISKSAAVIYVIVTILVILAVGLLVGLVGRPQSIDCEKPAITSTSASSTPGVVTSTTATTTTRQPTGPWDNIRLPPYLVPSNYMVDLQPELTPDGDGMYWFNGTSSVTFEVKDATDHIYIHSNRLNYSSVSVTDAAGTAVQVMDYWLHDEYQYLIVQLDADMSVGANYVLTTEFKGELADDLGGLYRSTYKNKAGNDVVIATTQMQPTDARKAFPCFDEPALKATFDIYLWYIEPYFALSNMPDNETVSMHGDWKRTKFDRTPVMSSYLLAFVVCDFKDTENTTIVDKVQTRIFARAQQVDEGNANYSAAITPIILQSFEEYFNVSYPLPKNDQIAVADFAAGAMENWGLVIYRETALLYNPEVNSASNKQRVAAVVAHELAHQWFGNLISPDWWDELWLNEGFASYIEYRGTESVEPTWRMNDQFIVSDLQRALRVDGLTSSRPIVALNVSTPSDINSLFDTISYSKGACVLRMINEFVGEAAFTGGLTKYLNANAYGSVNHETLFEYWTNEYTGSSIPGGFTEAMNTWILQMGFPTINMKRTASDVTSVVITQERFLLDTKADPNEPTSPYSYKWTTPLWYKEEGMANKSLIWISKDSTESIVVPTDKYFLGNYEAFGYYRVNYDDDNWRAITTALIDNHAVVDVRTRGQLLNDAFNLARSNKLDYDIAFNLTEFLLNDYDYISWESALDEMSYFDLVLGRSKVYGPYSVYLAYLVKPAYTNLTWNDGGTHLEQYQRINAIGAACTYGVDGCVSQALEKFNEWQNTSINNISPNLRTTVYCQAVANGDAEQWDFVWEQYLNETNSQEKAKLEYALTCTRIPWIIRRFLVNYALDDNFVRKQDASSVLQDLCYNEYARDITWDYIRQEWDYIYDVYGTGFFSFSGIISSCTSHFSTEFERDELQAFKDQNEGKLGSGLGTVNQALESTQTNIDWRAANEEKVYSWLNRKIKELGL